MAANKYRCETCNNIECEAHSSCPEGYGIFWKRQDSGVYSDSERECRKKQLEFCNNLIALVKKEVQRVEDRKL